jgi:hypothetical protein
MDATTAAQTIAGPLGDLGAKFYFSKQAIAQGEAIGLDVVSLYGAGRASMLGGVDPETADAAFYFFKPGMIAAVVTRGRGLATEDAIATAHLGSADDYAEATFAVVDSATLGAFTDAVGALVATVPRAPGRFSTATAQPRQHRPPPLAPTGQPSCCVSCASVCTAIR